MQDSIAGVDVGGTFTDFVFLDAAGRLTVRKRPSTPADPSQSVLQGLREAQAESVLAARFLLAHGTTVATNALLERRGAKTALLTTAGFRDVLAIGRQNRDTLYALHPSRPAPLLSRDACYEITERVNWRGAVETPLNEAECAALLDSLQAEGIESLAVCLLFSYLNPAHERRIGALARERGLHVSLSCEIAPEPREFERASTVAANAFVAPLLTKYLAHLTQQAKATGAIRLRVMQSNGGTLSAEEAGEQAVKTALSGPAGGVMAAAHLGRLLGIDHLITFDMGGTSTDVALIQHGECPVTSLGAVGGIPLRTPLLEIHTVGAGGGSIARRDTAGGLRVGPESAGAVPGPVAYGAGERLTVTDANVLLGRLPVEARLGGAMALDRGRVQAFFAEFSAALHLTPEAAALGILEVANAAMGRALRHVSVERGHDPKDFTLVSFGGAGGLHAAALAEMLAIRSVLVPRYPGAFSAVGLALSDVRRELVRSVSPFLLRPDSAHEMHERTYHLISEMAAQAGRAMDAEGIALSARLLQFYCDLRYAGQSHSLRVPCAAAVNFVAVCEAFHLAHRARYGYADSSEPVEMTALRLVAVGQENKEILPPMLPETPGLPVGKAPVYFAGTWHETALFRRDTLAAGQRIPGPAVVLQEDATTLVPPQWAARCDFGGNLALICG